METHKQVGPLARQAPHRARYYGKATTGGRHDHCPLRSRSCHHGCREPLFRLAKQGLSQISGRRVLRVIGQFVLSLSRRCFGAAVGDKFCRNTSDQRWPLHRPFHPLLALSLFWLCQEAKGLKRTPSHGRKLSTSLTAFRESLIQGRQTSMRAADAVLAG
jgi:hypothetical protein